MFKHHTHQILQQKLSRIHGYVVKLFISVGAISLDTGREIQLQGSEQYYQQTLEAQSK